MQNENKAINLFFCGMKHAGKTTHGKRYAQKKNFPFDDLDDWIKKIYLEKRGKALNPRQILRKEGREGFQSFETIALERWLAETENLAHPRILALGGGIASNQIATLLLTTNGYIIYLYQKEKLLWERMKKKGLPPYLGIFKKRNFQKLYKKRTEIYEILADCTIETENADKEKAATIIEKALDSFLETIQPKNEVKK